MVFGAVVLIIIASVSIIKVADYRNQIKSISRQLDFIKNHETNMIISGNGGDRSINELRDKINDFILDMAKLKKEYFDKQVNVKDTITSLSHDIRTPLTSLDGYLQLLSKSNNPDEQERYLGIIQKRIKSLKGIMEELFTYAKLQNDSYEIKSEKCCINKILLDVLFSFYSDFKKKGIEPKIQIGEDNLYVLGNEAALIRVFQNLIKNGLEHGEKYIRVQMEHVSEQVNIIFANKFESSEKIDTERIFDMFYKADSARSHNSTGLGLAIVKELVLRMNGTITADTSKDVFQINLQFNLVN